MNKREFAALLKTELLKTDVIPVGDLKFSRRRNNDAYHDSSNVFCKVTRSNVNPQNLWRELQFVKTFMHKTATFTPWVFDLIKIPTPTGPRWASAWLWEKDITITYASTVTPELATRMAEELTKIHQLTPQHFINPLNDDVINYNLEVRLRAAEPFNPSAEHVSVLRQLFRQYIVPENFRFKNLVINHGDCHVKNFVCKGGQFFWTDFESIRLAPREWDIATLALASRQFKEQDIAWDNMVKVFEDQQPVNFEWVNFFEIVKALATTSYLVMDPTNYNVFEERVETLEPLLRDSTFPQSFPVYSSSY